jgi:hypothetical protein
MQLQRSVQDYPIIGTQSAKVGYSSESGFYSKAIGMNMDNAMKNRRAKAKAAKKARRKNR